MKRQLKILLLTALLSVTAVQVKSQNWLLNGNSSVGPDALTTTNNFLGSSSGNSVDLKLGTNGNTVMTLTTGQNVGIGTTTPNYLLQTYEGSASANYIQVGNSTSGSTSSDGFLFGLDASANAVLNQQENLPMIFSTNNTEQMRIASDGNVGIGTDTPNYPRSRKSSVG